MGKYDLIVVGSGPGGYVAAIRASQLGMRTAVVEQDELGGVCLNWGCIPTKSILHSAEQFDAVARGVPGLVADSVRPDYPAVIDASRKAARRLSRGVRSLMKKNRIDVLAGRGELGGPGQVVVRTQASEEVHECDRTLLATGSSEWVFPGVEVDGQRVLTSREALDSKRLPESIAIVGGGAVGVEFAYAYACYGVRVTLIELQDQLLPGFDRQIAEELARAFERRGISVLLGTSYRSLERPAEGVSLTVEGQGEEREVSADQVLFAVGRRARVDGLGLEGRGVEVKDGFIRVGEDLRTTAPDVWAIGDCNGPPLLAHAASHEGVAAAEFMAGVRRRGVDPLLIPGNVYCQPQVATIGLSEAQARERGHDVQVGKLPFVASGKAVATGHTTGFVKLVADSRYGEVLGCQIIGAGATEMINEIAFAMTLECSVTEVAEVCRAHPTLSEVLAEAALSAEGRAINF
ncbi:MAG: dihydrolipoyl dehydrogenase [Proteobacteria bacterium]|nr:dihydrolipoyl dehydrogenase [Pseudomonadota bacterium]